MGERDRILRDYILPSALEQEIDEIIVAGRVKDSVKRAFPESERLRYLHVEPRVLWRTESGHIRAEATEEASGDILIYTPDDHALAPNFVKALEEAEHYAGEWDVWCPSRRHGLTGRILNNGLDEGYMGWHGNVLRQWVAAAVPWDYLSPKMDFQDVPMTRLWEKVGARLEWGAPLFVIDVEAEEDEE